MSSDLEFVNEFELKLNEKMKEVKDQKDQEFRVQQAMENMR